MAHFNDTCVAHSTPPESVPAKTTRFELRVIDPDCQKELYAFRDLTMEFSLHEAQSFISAEMAMRVERGRNEDEWFWHDMCRSPGREHHFGFFANDNLVGVLGLSYGNRTIFHEFLELHGRTAYVGNAYVKPEFRGQGAMFRFKRAVIDWAHDHDVRKLRFHVYDANKPVVDLCRVLGAKPIAVEWRRYLNHLCDPVGYPLRGLTRYEYQVPPPKLTR